MWLVPVTPTPSQVCGWFHANFKGFRHNMLTAFNESAKRIGGPPGALALQLCDTLP